MLLLVCGISKVGAICFVFAFMASKHLEQTWKASSDCSIDGQMSISDRPTFASLPPTKSLLWLLRQGPGRQLSECGLQVLEGCFRMDVSRIPQFVTYSDMPHSKG